MEPLTRLDDDDRARAVDEVRARRVRLRSAMEALETALAAPVPGRVTDWWAVVVDCLAQLRVALQRHIVEAEADSGLLAQVLTDAPRLANAVNRLRQDHVEMVRAVDALVSRPAPTSDDSAAIRDAGLALLGRLARHRHRGADLLYEAYSVDVGSGE
jgi:hypothetical protein